MVMERTPINSTDLLISKKDKHNLIIGVNGSGKSRLLDSIKKNLETSESGNNITIYADFAHLSHGFTLSEIKTREKGSTKYQGTTVNVAINDAEAVFENYLKKVDEDRPSYVSYFFDENETDDEARGALNRFLKPLLNMKFDHSNMVMTENGKTYTKTDFLKRITEMSPGENSLLCMSFLLGSLSRKKRRNNMWFLIDEPESHLHPDILVKFIKLLKSEFSESHIFVASHSIHLLPLFEFKEIIHMESGFVQEKNSKTLGKIYMSLLGSQDSVDHVLMDLYSIQFLDFVQECFEYPEAVSEKEKDPQFDVFLETIKNKRTIKVLDYGAGKCRFGKMFDDVFADNSRKVQYNTYYGELKDIKQYLPKCHHKHYSEQKDLPEGDFDAILLVNTLHEIPINDWEPAINSIQKSLVDGGYLFFSEVLSLRKGEDPKTEHGYLVLGKPEVKILFGDVIAREINNDQESPIALYAIIPKSKLKIKITEIERSLRSLEETSKNKYWDYFRKTDDGRGRLCAFYAIQSLNANKATSLLKPKLLSSSSNSTDDIRRSYDNSKEKIEETLLRLNAEGRGNQIPLFLWDCLVKALPFLDEAFLTSNRQKDRSFLRKLLQGLDAIRRGSLLAISPIAESASEIRQFSSPNCYASAVCSSLDFLVSRRRDETHLREALTSVFLHVEKNSNQRERQEYISSIRRHLNSIVSYGIEQQGGTLPRIDVWREIINNNSEISQWAIRNENHMPPLIQQFLENEKKVRGIFV